jgi:ATP-dependent DNA helicase RecG
MNPTTTSPNALELLDLPGIGPVRAAALAEAGIHGIDDFLTLAPRRYEDRSGFLSLSQLAELAEGRKGTVLVQIKTARCIRTRRRGFTLTRATVTDGADDQEVVWYNQPFLARHLHPGRRLILYGSVQPARSKGRPPQLENPELELLPEDQGPEQAIHMGRVVPVHPRIAGLSPRNLRRLFHLALAGGAAAGPDFMPAELLAGRGWPTREQAIRELHFPVVDTDPDRLEAWRTSSHRRLIYEEFLLLFTALERQRRHRCREPRSWTPAWSQQVEQRLRDRLPFTLTRGQSGAWETIREDLLGPHPMARLLQGDVGSGKTAVAILAMLLVLESGRQAAFMAPTELLALQHHQRLQDLLRPAGVQVSLMVGGSRDAAARRLREELAAGATGLVIGTHALFQKSVRFANLGLVVIDEQHRFGVSQRTRLEEKGRRPDLLVMTATPIPRSLALTRYGDLDLVEIRDRPPGRTPVQTEVGAGTIRSRAMAMIRAEVAAGRQAYVVYPLVAESEKLDLTAASEGCAELAAGALAGLQLGLVHGQMASGERQKIMQSFVAGDIQVLVATSVIEVGIDVANATVLVVEHAERFGLAQLHQLRGRVGRGHHASRCYLLHPRDIAPVARERLGVLIATQDGFEVARQDLKLRGPGELMGLRQHGSPGLRLADIVRDEDLLEQAREDCRGLASSGMPEALLTEACRRWEPLTVQGGAGEEV